MPSTTTASAAGEQFRDYAEDRNASAQDVVYTTVSYKRLGGN